MDSSKESLKELTNSFYMQVADAFDSTRHYQWQGWGELVKIIKEKDLKVNSVLDVACGNGRFAETVYTIDPNASYCGIDNNDKLLEIASKKYSASNVTFKKVDVFGSWNIQDKFDLVVAFGITHHLIDKEAKVEFFSKIALALSESGLAVVTFWDFLSDPQLSKKILTKENFSDRINGENKDNINSQLKADIFDALGPNDHILDWKKGSTAYRFCHYFSKDEIDEFIYGAGLSIINAYYADGPNNRSNHYFLLQKK